MLRMKINGRCSPVVGSGSSSENPPYRFAIAMNRFNTPRVLADRRYAFAVDPWLVPNASKTSTAEV